MGAGTERTGAWRRWWSPPAARFPTRWSRRSSPPRASSTAGRWISADRLGCPAMRAVVINKHGGPGVLEVQERPDPELASGEVRIDVAAAGINFADVMARMGLYQDAPKTPCIVGYEVAGTILELGGGGG